MEDQDKWASIVVEEFQNGTTDNQRFIDDYEAYLDLFDAIRSEKDYDWQSDVFIPELPAHMLTQLGIDVEQWFKTRDFIETYLQSAVDSAQRKAMAAELCINNTLNSKEVHYFQKFCRMKLITSLGGHVYARCWWEKRYGDNDELKCDHFQFDILDPRQVRTSSEYTYSIQDKKWVTLWYDMSLNDLESNKEKMGYFNLDKLGKPSISELENGITHKDDPVQEEVFDPNKKFDIYERHGWAWIVKTENGYEPGIDEHGDKKEGAKWERTISAVAGQGANKTLIRFQKEPFVREDYNETYYPLIRGLCYIHPNDDKGVGNGRYSRELQIAINDAYNLGLDRSRLATIPVLKGKKYTMEDNSSVFIEPGHVISLEDPNDLQELKITDNTNGQLNQISFLAGKMSQVDSMFPSVQGQMPAASATATAIAGTEQRANTRTNLTSMTFEYTFMAEFYWMILQMTSQFAEPETGYALMGESVYDFDPSPDYWFKPVTQTVETESSKAAKIAQLNQSMATISQLGDPRPVNMLLGEIMKLMGKEQENLYGRLFPENQPLANQGTPGSTGGTPSSNQNGIPQSSTEQLARGAY